MNITTTYCSGIALINNGKIFLIRPFLSNNDKWGIPKGHIELNEDVEKTALREFNEETGIKIVGNITYFSTVTTRFKNKVKNVNVYKCISGGAEKFIKSNIITEGELKGNPENINGQWFLYEEALEKIHKYQIPIIQKLKNEDKLFKTFCVNREATSDASDLIYNKTICIYINDSGQLSKDDLDIIKKYSNMVDKIIAFSISSTYKYKDIDNLKVIQIDNNLTIEDIIRYIEQNVYNVNVIIGTDKRKKMYIKLQQIKEYFKNDSIVNILDIKKYSIGK